MNRTFKVAKSLTRGTVVTSEKASSYQGKAVKTVVAAAVAALVTGTAAAATTAADDLILGADGSLTKNKANVTAVVTGTAYTTVDGKQVAWDGTRYSHTGTTAVKLQGGKIVVDATGYTGAADFTMGKGEVTGTGTIAVTADTKAATLQAKGGLDLTKADITLAGSKAAASVVAKDAGNNAQAVSLKEGSINFTSGTGVLSGRTVTLGVDNSQNEASTVVALNVSKDVAATVSATNALSLTNVTFSNAGTLTLKGDTVALGSAFDAAANTGKTVFDGATTVSKSFKGTVVELNTANKADKASQQVFTGNVTVNADTAFSADKLTVAANKLTNNGTLTAADAVFTAGEEHELAGKNTFGTLAIGNTAANATNAVKVTSKGTLAVTDTVTLKGNTATSGLATLDVTAGTATLAKANVADFGVLSTSGQAALTVSDTLTVAGSAVAKTASVTLGGKSAKVANLVVNAYGTAAVSGGEVALDNVKVGNNGSVSVTNGDVTLGKLELAAAVTTPAAAPAGAFNVTGGTLTTEGANLFSYDATKTGLVNQVALKGGVSFAGATLVLTDSTFNGKAIEYTVADYSTLLGKLGQNSDLQLLNGTLISKTADGKTAQASITEAAHVGYTGKTAVAWKYGKAAAEFTNGNKDLTVGSVNFAPAEGSTVKLTSAKLDANGNGKTVAFLSDAQGKVFTGAVDKDGKDVAITLTNGTFAFGDKDGQANVGTVTNKVVLEGDTTVYDDFTFGDIELKGHNLTVAGKLSANDITRAAQETTTVQNGATLVLTGTAPATKAAGDPQTVEAAVTLDTVAETSKKGGLFVVGAQNLANAQALAAEAGAQNVVYVGQAVNFKGGVTGAGVLGIDLASVVKSGYKATAENAIVTGVKGTNSLVVDGLKEVGKSGLVYNAKMDGYYVNSGLANLKSVDFGTDLYTFDDVDGHAYVVVDELAVKELEALGLNSEGAVKQALNNIEFGQNEIADQIIFDLFGTTTTNAYFVAADKAWAEYQAELVKAGKWPADEGMQDVLEQEFFAPYIEQLVNAEHAATNMAALGGVFTTTLDVNDQVTAAVNRRTSAARVTGFTPWVDVFGTSNEAKRLYGSDAGYEADIYGAVLGFDYTAQSGTTFGLAVNVGQADGNSVGSGAKVDNDADFYGVSVYGAQTLGDFNLKADFGYTQVSNDLSTSNVLGSYKESLDSDVLTFGVGAEYLAKFGALSVTPHAGIRLNRISIDDSKFGASYDDMTVYQLPLGVAFSGTFDVNGWKLAPVVDLSVVPAFGDKDAVATYTGGITSTTRVVDTNPLQAKLGVEAQNGAWAFGLNYGLTAGGEDRLNNALNANVRYSF